MQFVLIPVLVATVYLTVRAELKRDWTVFLFKPLSTMLVLGVAMIAVRIEGASTGYALAVALGLLLSLFGDIALMFDSDGGFLTGVGCFAAAHVVYTITFARAGDPGGSTIVPAIVLLVLGIAVYAWLYRHLGRMRIPVAIYGLIISAMVCATITTLGAEGVSTAQSILLVVGAGLFYASDLLMAANKFVKPVPALRATNLSSYYLAQLLIALSAAYSVG